MTNINVKNGELLAYLSTTKENLVKIIRADSIGNINWDDNNSNDWTNASLHKSLNGDYLNPNDSGIYTNVSAIRAINATTLGMIESVKWHLGGASSVSMTTSEYYTAERGTETYQNSRPTIWPAKVGLIYSSDYGYATSGGGTTRDVCLTTKMDSWGTSPYNIDCAANSWLKPSSGTLWTLTSHSVSSTHVFYVASGGIMFNDYAGLVSLVYPSLYLKSNVKVLDDKISDGSIDKPYILVP